MSKVIIIGGGIAGLCSAISLVRKGIEVKVYERTPTPTEAGAGIIIAPNALQALEKIDMATSILKASLGNDGICLMTNKGRKLSKLDRKSTRLNSSHVAISYAVLSLKKNT